MTFDDAPRGEENWYKEDMCGQSGVLFHRRRQIHRPLMWITGDQGVGKMAFGCGRSVR